MARVKLSGVKFPGYPTKEIARDVNNFLTSQGVFFKTPIEYRRECRRLGYVDIHNPDPIEILIEIREGSDGKGKEI